MPRSHRKRPIIAFGDSLVEGIGASTGHDWVSLLSARYHVPILNKGRKQDTTRTAQARLDEDVFRHNPLLVILLLGGNDIIFRIPKKETFFNLGSMIDRIQHHGAGVLLVGVRGGILADAFEGQFQALAEKKAVPLIANILEDILPDPTLMSDPLHPNDAGYRIMADRIDCSLTQVVQQNVTSLGKRSEIGLK